MRPPATSVRLPRPRSGGSLPTAPPSPTSLIKLPPSGTPTCAECGSTRVTRIAMTLTDGTPVQFTNCRHCEHRAWSGEGEVLPVAAVLAKATRQR